MGQWVVAASQMQHAYPHSPWRSIHVSTPAAENKLERHFQYEIGGVMERSSRHPDGRYKIVRELGSGVYGRVLECTDEKGKTVAIKAVRAEQAYRECAKREIFALQTIGVHDNVCRMLGSFSFRGHTCIVQELIPGGTVYDKLKTCGGYSLQATQQIASQLLTALAHIHHCNIIHTDIKTDNIMIDGTRDDGTPRIKLVDLGSAVSLTDRRPDLIGTKEYRSPEAVLQAGWSSSADVWALGCSVFEIFAGKRLFEFEHEITQLHMLQRVLSSKLPPSLLHRAFLRRNQHSFHLLSPSAVALAPPVSTEAGKIMAALPLTKTIAHPGLLFLLQQMLAVEAAARPSAKTLRLHPFFNLEIHDQDLEVESDKALLSPSKALSVACTESNNELEESGSLPVSPTHATNLSRAHSVASTVELEPEEADAIRGENDDNQVKDGGWKEEKQLFDGVEGPGALC